MMRNPPHVFIGLSQSPGVYRLAFVHSGLEWLLFGSLEDFESVAHAIQKAIDVQREIDVELASGRSDVPPSEVTDS